VLCKACIGLSEGTVQFGWGMCWAFNKQGLYLKKFQLILNTSHSPKSHLSVVCLIALTSYKRDGVREMA
jgi:hypothetical protein